MSGWYEGYIEGLPSTNNALESTNKTIKDSATLRKRYLLAHFLSLVEEKIVRKWSIQRDPSSVKYKAFATEATFAICDYRSAFQLLKKAKRVVKIRRSSLMFVPASDNPVINK